jgi:hypothetical protein
MKKLITICFLLFFSIVINAQWYYNSINVTKINDLNQDQLNLALIKANKSIKTGQIMTGVGAGFAIIGAVIYGSGLTGIVNSGTTTGINNNLNKSMAGAYIMGGGAIVAGIGIPIWISGSMRKNDIEIALVKFKTTGYINGIGLKISF